MYFCVPSPGHSSRQANLPSGSTRDFCTPRLHFSRAGHFEFVVLQLMLKKYFHVHKNKLLRGQSYKNNQPPDKFILKKMQIKPFFII